MQYKSSIFNSLALAAVFALGPLSHSTCIAKGKPASTKQSSLSKDAEIKYLSSVRERLLNAWSPAISANAKVEILFRINPNGTVTWIEVSDASSSTGVNTAASDAISYSQPFAKLPKGVKYLDVKAVFDSNVSSSATGGYSRPTQDRRRKARALYKEAFQLKQKGSLSQACSKLEEALDASPFNFRIKEKYVDCLLEHASSSKDKQAELLHKALLALPRSTKVKMALDEYWKSQNKDPNDFETRAKIAKQYDLDGKPEDAVAEYGIVWYMNPDPQLIPEVNLASKHARAWKDVEKWERINRLRPSPGITLSYSNALKKAGAYKKSAQVFDKEFAEDPLVLRQKELESVSKTKLSPFFPFAVEDKKSIELATIKNRKRSVNYLKHAIKNQKAVIRWTPGRFPLSVYVKNGRGIKGYKPIYNKMVIDAFNTWAKASKNRLSFVPVGGEKGANIVVTWTSKPQELKRLSGKEQGVTYFKYQKARKGNYTISSAEITILTVRRTNTSIALGSKLMKSVILHELGHSLGIAGHSPYRSDIMYPMLNPFNPTLDLTDRDAATIVRLYQGYEHQ